jgi:hypothetical protein
VLRPSLVSVSVKPQVKEDADKGQEEAENGTEDIEIKIKRKIEEEL